jgi:hypothetical protein
MLWLKLFFLLLLGLLALVLVRGFWGAVRFRHRFNDTSKETAERLRQHLEEKTSPEQGCDRVGAMSEKLSPDEIHKIERELLRALCAGVIAGAKREEVVRFLTAYSFEDVVHEQVFQALQELRASSASLIREQLPARVTQKGFPDVDFESFLKAPNSMPCPVDDLLEQLRRGSPEA